MVRLDDGAFAEAGFNNVRIDGALDEEVDRTDLLCFFFEYADEFFTDDLSFLLRFFHTGELTVETLLGIDADEVEVIRSLRTEYRFHLVAFVLSEKTVIYEYAGQLLTDCLGKKNSSNRRVYTAGKSAEDFTVSDFFADLFDRGLDKRIHLPVTSAFADAL